MYSNGILPSQLSRSRTRFPERVRTTEVGTLLMTAISYVNDEVNLKAVIFTFPLAGAFRS
jgi:hypothetical protein